MGKKSDAPEAPDYSQVAAASERAAEIAAQVSREQLAWAQEQYRRDSATTERVMGVLLPAYEEELRFGAETRQNLWDTYFPAIQQETQEAMRLRERWRTQFEPLEDRIIQDAQTYDSPERMERDAGRAMADVTQQFAIQREQLAQRLESYGVDPSQTRGGAIDANLRAQEAAATAGAGTMSRERTENTGRALRGEAVNMGKGIPGNVAGALGAVQGLGGQGMGAATGAIGQGFSGGMGAVQTRVGTSSAYMGALGNGAGWAGLQQGATGQQGNLMNMGYQNQLAGWDAQSRNQGQWGQTIGGLAGTALGAYIMRAEGGPIQGAIPDPTGRRDDVPVAASDGEFMIPRSVVEAKGTEFFEKLIQKYGDDRDRGASQRRSALPVH